MINLESYKKTLTTPLKQATICLLVKDNEVLLAMKKTGFGAGKWNGPGGKSNPGESILEAAIREVREEIAVIPINPEVVAQINFYFPLVPLEKEWNQQVFVFKTDEWEGKPSESEEMKPAWFEFNEIPYHQMWPDDLKWLSLVLAGKKIIGEFLYDENDTLLEYKIKPVRSIKI